MKRFFIVLTLAFLAMTVSTKSIYAQMVNREYAAEAPAAASKYDFNLPGLKLNSIEDLPKLPDFEALTTQPEKGSLKSLYNRIKNDLKADAALAERKIRDILDASSMIPKGYFYRDSSEDMLKDQQTKEKQTLAVYVKWLQTIDKFEETIQEVSEFFAPGTFDKYVKALDNCRNDTLLVMSRSYFETLSKCLTDMEDKDPDWKTIADSLEGLLKIKSIIHQPSLFSGYEENLETFRIQLKYQVKRNRMTDKNLQNRLEQLFDRCEKEIAAQKDGALEVPAAKATPARE